MRISDFLVELISLRLRKSLFLELVHSIDPYHYSESNLQSHRLSRSEELEVTLKAAKARASNSSHEK